MNKILTYGNLNWIKTLTVLAINIYKCNINMILNKWILYVHTYN